MRRYGSNEARKFLTANLFNLFSIPSAAVPRFFGGRDPLNYTTSRRQNARGNVHGARVRQEIIDKRPTSVSCIAQHIPRIPKKHLAMIYYRRLSIIDAASRLKRDSVVAAPDFLRLIGSSNEFHLAKGISVTLLNNNSCTYVHLPRMYH